LIYIGDNAARCVDATPIDVCGHSPSIKAAWKKYLQF
jgi:hypothetical protein